MFDWDDIRIFVAAARAGSLGGAAQRLGIDAATVGRRVARLESALKSTLVVRSASGLQLTPAGAQLLEVGLQAETAMSGVGDLAQADAVAGTVRISTSEGFGGAVLAPALPDLRRKRPGLRIELAASAGYLSASRREVDMAITLNTPDSGRLIVEPLTPYQLALYASSDYLEHRTAPDAVEDLTGFEIVGYVDDLIITPELRYLDEVRPGLTPHLAQHPPRGARHGAHAGGADLGQGPVRAQRRPAVAVLEASPILLILPHRGRI